MSEDMIGNDVAALYEYAIKKGSVPTFMRQFFKAGDVSGLAGAINVVYGALVYDQVNREANAHAIIKKEPWANSGFRVTTGNPATKGYGGADPGSVGAVIDVTPSELKSIPGFLHTPYDVTLDAGFRARHDDGLDVYEWKRAIMRDVHATLLNEEILRSAEVSQDDSTGVTTDAKNSAATTDAAARGKGLESLDRIIASENERDGVGGNTNSGWYDLYEGDIDRDSGTTYDSVVIKPDGTTDTFSSTTAQAFSMTCLDALIDNTEQNGADPTAQTFLTGRGTRRKFYDELGSAGRYDLTTVSAALSMAGLSTSALHPGRDITFTIRAYQDRPIVVDKNVPYSGVDTFTFPQGDAATYSQNLYLLDQRHIHLKVGFPTLYVDVDNPVIRGQFDTKALYLTCEQLYATRFNTSGKCRQIAA